MQKTKISSLRNWMWRVVPFQVFWPPSFKPIPQNITVYSRSNMSWTENTMNGILAAAWRHGFGTSANLIRMKPAKSTRSASCFKKRNALTWETNSLLIHTKAECPAAWGELLSATFSSSRGEHWISWLYEALLQPAKCIFSKCHPLDVVGLWTEQIPGECSTLACWHFWDAVPTTPWNLSNDPKGLAQKWRLCESFHPQSQKLQQTLL